MEWLHLVQDNDNLWKVVRTVFGIQISQNAGNVLDAVSKRNLLHVVCWLVI